ncbi:hypothetical protein BGZ70_010163 [Mortierella alpina]|uniref:Chromatin target of PRMT1 protein C-terminal domain-containing protein n=1 Tax=Mortierella alpina TaxID=64518 RepID=A0A9P6IZW2_MORAP|nr:hypothetical protein BGZ70_010163 [Mortierella alpina]
MSAQQRGQILYLGGSTGSSSGPGGSLSTRFQKLAQARNSGITVVNPQTALESRPGRALGLGHATGSQTPGQGGARITANRNHGPKGTGGASAAGGILTKAGLARAMQERGGGVSDAFLLTPADAIVGAGGPSRRTKGVVRAAGPVVGAANTLKNHPTTRASRHKALMLAGRPGKGTPVQQRPQPGQAGKGGRGGLQTAGVSKANGAGNKKFVGPKGVGATTAKGETAAAGKGKGKGKGKGLVKPGPAKATDLDSELQEYMMKNEQTAVGLLDNDLDTYMADKEELF